MTGNSVVEVEQFVDVSCPWCHGSLETSRRLLDEVAADPDLPHVRLAWRFMRLHPMPREGGLPVDDVYATWGDGDRELVVAAAREQVRSFVRGVGAWVDFTRYTWMHDPQTAHRLLAIVRDDDGDDLPSLWMLARAVFAANFVRGVDIADHAALRGGIERAGLVLPLRIWERLTDDDEPDPVAVDHARALEVELDGVPRMRVNGEIIPTWIDADEVRRRLRDALVAAVR